MKLFKITAIAGTVLAASLLFCTAHAAVRDSDIPVDIEVNGSYINSTASAYIKNGYTFAPVRILSNALGAKVQWDGNAGKVSITSDTGNIEFYNNSNIAYVNGEKKQMTGGMNIINGTSFVPVRFLAENLGADVNWDNIYFTVRINKDNHTLDDSLKKNSYYEDNLFWLARIVEAESAGEPLAGKVAVGNVVLNRVKSSEYPNSIYGVIFDRTFGVQFQPVLNGHIYNTPSAESIVAAKRAMLGEDIVGDCLYFLNPDISTNTWIIKNRVYYKTIENHDFYL